MSEDLTIALLFLGLYVPYKVSRGFKDEKRMILLGDSIKKLVVCSGID